MKRLHLAVFFGGCSPEYSVSLESAAAVLRNLDQEKYRLIPIGITPEGEWYYYTGDVSKIAEDTWRRHSAACIPAVLSPDRKTKGLLLLTGGSIEQLRVDVALPILHGQNGEDGTIQGLIALAGIPLVGCDVLSSALCMDKARAHAMASAAGIAVPKSNTFNRSDSLDSMRTYARALGYPLFVKPVRAGSSYGVSAVWKESELEPAVSHAFQYDSEILLEERIAGSEVGCAVIGRDTLTVGEIDEIELSGGFFDYTEKYTLKTAVIHVPATIEKSTSLRIQETAKALYRVMGCSGFARVDMFLTPENQIFFHEINTIPGFTEHSRFPGMMRAAGMPLPQLLETVIQEALQ